MLRWMAMVAAAFASAMPSMADAARPVISWGRAGVSYDQYRADGIACAIAARNADIDKETAAIRYKRGFEVLERENNMPPMEGRDLDDPFVRAQRQVLLRRAYGPTRAVDQLQIALTEKVSACLTDQGYRQFVLTAEQRRRLDRLAVGDEARRRYLHGLGSDGAVLDAQALQRN